MIEHGHRDDPLWKKFEKQVYSELKEKLHEVSIELAGGSNSTRSDIIVNNKCIECKLGSGAKAAPFIVTINEKGLLEAKYKSTDVINSLRVELLNCINMNDEVVKSILNGGKEVYSISVESNPSVDISSYVYNYYKHRYKDIACFATTSKNDVGKVIYIEATPEDLRANFTFNAYFHRHSSGPNYVNYYWKYAKPEKSRDIRDSLIHIFNLNYGERDFFDLESNYVSDSNKIYYKSYIDTSKARKSLRNVWFIPDTLLIDSNYPDIIELYQIDDRGRDLFLRKCSLEHEQYTSKEGFTGYALMARSNTASMEVYIYMKYTGSIEHITSADKLVL